MTVPRHAINNKQYRTQLARHFDVDPAQIIMTRRGEVSLRLDPFEQINGKTDYAEIKTVVWSETELYELLDRLHTQDRIDQDNE